MPKAIIEYDLSSPDDQWEFKLTGAASEMYLAISDFTRIIREKRKYSEEKPQSWYEVSDLWYQHVGDLLARIEEG